MRESKVHSEVQFLWVCGICLDNSTKDASGGDPDCHAILYANIFRQSITKGRNTVFKRFVLVASSARLWKGFVPMSENLPGLKNEWCQFPATEVQ